MRVNDVLESFNKTIEEERHRTGVKNKGHFISVITIEKAMGPYKKYHVVIFYIDTDNKKNIEFISKYYTHKVNKGKEDSIQKIVECEVLTAFFSKIIKYLEDIIKGEYGDK